MSSRCVVRAQGRQRFAGGIFELQLAFDQIQRLRGIVTDVEQCLTGAPVQQRGFAGEVSLAFRAQSIERHTALEQADIDGVRSEEHTSELQSLMRISYAVFCLKK